MRIVLGGRVNLRTKQVSVHHIPNNEPILERGMGIYAIMLTMEIDDPKWAAAFWDGLDSDGKRLVSHIYRHELNGQGFVI